MSPRRTAALALLPFVIALGFFFKFYRGPFAQFVNNVGPASVAYEIVWMLLAFACFPDRKWLLRIAISVCVITCGLEFLQLWHPDWLESLRRTLPGKFILGTSFSWWDFPAYPVGCLIGYVILQSICNRFPTDAEKHDAIS